jgi:hypothetical protein
MGDAKIEYMAPKVITPEIQLIIWLDGLLEGKQVLHVDDVRALKNRVNGYLRPPKFIVSESSGVKTGQ